MLTQRRGRVRLIAPRSVVDVNRLFSIVIESDRGWKSTKVALLPVEGEIFFLTFPFIEQAFTLRTIRFRSVNAILQCGPINMMPVTTPQIRD